MVFNWPAPTKTSFVPSGEYDGCVPETPRSVGVVELTAAEETANRCPLVEDE
jgi:hypothetical protein